MMFLGIRLARYPLLFNGMRNGVHSTQLMKIFWRILRGLDHYLNFRIIWTFLINTVMMLSLSNILAAIIRLAIMELKLEKHQLGRSKSTNKTKKHCMLYDDWLYANRTYTFENHLEVAIGLTFQYRLVKLTKK